MSIDSLDSGVSSTTVAASLEARASEIAAAAKLYQRLPAYREDLAAGLESLMGGLNHQWGVFLRKCAEEAAHGPR